MDYFTPTEMLADWLRPVEQELNYELSHGDKTEAAGGRSVLAARASRHEGYTEEAMLRRLFAICNLDSYKTDANIADVLADAAGFNWRDTYLPTFPGNRWSATEMVAIANEEQDLRLTAFEQKQLARSLYNFTRGFQMAYDRPNRKKRRQMKIDARDKRAALRARREAVAAQESDQRELVLV